jgi:hypothetical protein
LRQYGIRGVVPVDASSGIMWHVLLQLLISKCESRAVEAKIIGKWNVSGGGPRGFRELSGTCNQADV